MASTREIQIAGLIFGSTLALTGALVVACSSSSNPAPQPTYTVEAGGDSPTTDSGTSLDSGSPESGTSVPEGGDAGVVDAASDAASCTPQFDGGARCWTCPAQSDGSIEYLNQCSGTGVRCVPFSNSVLPGYDAGGLPAL
jgi:hypothetical protein